MSLIRDAARMYDIHSVLGVPSRKRVIVCPLPFHVHQSNTASFSIFNGRDGQEWKCHGSCGMQGDVVDLVGYMKVPGYDGKNPEHIKRVLQILGSGYQIAPVEFKKVDPFGLPNEKWKEFPATESVYAYAATHEGLTRATVDYFRLGQADIYEHHWMSIPTFRRERLLSIKLRNLEASGNRDRFSNVKGGMRGLFNFNNVVEKEEPVLIVKSEIPCMLLHQYGLLVCAPTVSENVWAEAKSWYVDLSFSAKRVLVADNDPDLKVRAEIMKFAHMRAMLLHAELRTPPEQFKDIDAWILAEGDLAVSTIKGWMQ